MQADLVIFKKNGKCIEIPIKTGVTVVGRRPECDVRIPVGIVSRKHCRIVKKDDQFVLQDLGSANGTFLNSKRIMEEVITAGDRISIGTFHFTVRIDGKPENIQPPEESTPNPKNQSQGANASHGSTIEDFPGENNTSEADNSPAADADPLAELEPLADFDNLDDSSVRQRA
jgi:pSer/pThr/pTyr-binding forkhead associated (FHA) protein